MLLYDMWVMIREPAARGTHITRERFVILYVSMRSSLRYHQLCTHSFASLLIWIVLAVLSSDAAPTAGCNNVVC